MPASTVFTAFAAPSHIHFPIPTLPVRLPLPALRRSASHREPRNKLAHCFACQKNLNTIDLLMTLGYDFVTAVAILDGWLDRHQSRLPKPRATPEGK